MRTTLRSAVTEGGYCAFRVRISVFGLRISFGFRISALRHLLQEKRFQMPLIKISRHISSDAISMRLERH